MQGFDLDSQLEQLRREYEEKKVALLEPVKERIKAIRQQITDLEAEERKLRSSLNLPAAPGTARAPRRATGRRLSAQKKKEIVTRFVNDGHIKDGSELSKELRTALADEGLMPYDFPKINQFLPEGWSSVSNGMRGLSAKTTFHRR